MQVRRSARADAASPATRWPAQASFTVDAGGPVARAVLPGVDGDEIEEDQVFLVAANMAPTRASVAANAYCAVDGIGEKIPVDVLPAGRARASCSAALGTDELAGRAPSSRTPACRPTLPADAAGARSARSPASSR